MDKSKATVTIPYEEFEKHEEQVKEIEWAREIKRKMDSGELYDKEVVIKLAEKVKIFGEYIAIPKDTLDINIHEYARQNGYKANAEYPINRNPIILLEKINKNE